MNAIGIFMNCDKRNSVMIGKQIAARLAEKGIKPLMLSGQVQEAGEIPEVISVTKDAFYEQPDCIVVLGGDGTLLGVARQAASTGIPICGINLGKLGFLTSGESLSYEKVLDDLIAGNYAIEERMMLKCVIEKNGNHLSDYVALNDVVIKSNGVRMITINIDIDFQNLDRLSADGLILSTATGSTGYSLAAGGPVVAPDAEVILINPICPHRLHDRAYVVAGKSVAMMTLLDRANDSMVSIDGQIAVPVGRNDRIIVTKSPFVTHLIRMNDMHFFTRLKRKFSPEEANG